MSVRPVDELAALVAEVRALAEAASGAGHLSLPEGGLPEPAEGGVEPDAAAPARAAENSSGWSALAAEARRAPVVGEPGLRAIRGDMGDCRRCKLHKGRRNIVFGVGNPDADLVVVGEGPGYHEDRTGEPFVGKAGEMLDKMLVHVLALDRSRSYILNIVKCRPPNNRDPEPDEIAACRPFLERQLDALQPKVLLVLGRVAYRTVFDEPRASIKRARGRWREYRGVPVMPTFHPAYLLRQPQDKRLTFEDLQALRARYDALGGRH